MELLYKSPLDELREIKADLEADLAWYRTPESLGSQDHTPHDRRRHIKKLKSQLSEYNQAIDALMIDNT